MIGDKILISHTLWGENIALTEGHETMIFDGLEDEEED